jgi:integrase
LNLNNLLARVILPALNRCRHCGGREGKLHLRHDHEYERDARIPEWHGWHAARRGLGSNLYHYGVSNKIIQQILRHSNVAVTLEYYVKTMNKDVRAAMTNLEENFEKETAAQALRDSDRTVKLASGATPESVN